MIDADSWRIRVFESWNFTYTDRNIIRKMRQRPNKRKITAVPIGSACR